MMKSDHDLLIEMHTDLQWLKGKFGEVCAKIDQKADKEDMRGVRKTISEIKLTSSIISAIVSIFTSFGTMMGLKR